MLAGVASRAPAAGGADDAAAGQPAPTGLDDGLGRDANRIDELCTIGGATD